MSTTPPWANFVKSNSKKVTMKDGHCIRFSKDKEINECNDITVREDSYYIYDPFNKTDHSNLPTRKMHPFQCTHPVTGVEIQLVTYKNERNDIIAWVDGSADKRTDIDPKSGCSVWFGDNWFTSQSSPFTEIPEMADITCGYTNKHLSSTQIEGCAILMVLIVAHKYKFKSDIEIRTDSLQCLLKMKKLVIVPSNDYIMQLIWKYMKINLSEGRSVMVTFVRRESDYGNRQADALAYKARLGDVCHEFGSPVNLSMAKSFHQLSNNRSNPQTKDLYRSN